MTLEGWCPLCGGDYRLPDHEDACRLKLSQLRPTGIVTGDDDQVDALMYAFRSAGARRPGFLVDAVYTCASSHARYGPDDERYLEVWQEQLARYRGEHHEQFYIRDARIVMEREWDLRTERPIDRERVSFFNHAFDNPAWKVTDWFPNDVIDVEGQEHGHTSTAPRQLDRHGESATS